jgi:hypothetical protein
VGRARRHAIAGDAHEVFGVDLTVLVMTQGITYVDLRGSANFNGDLIHERRGTTWEIRTDLGRHARAGDGGREMDKTPSSEMGRPGRRRVQL